MGERNRAYYLHTDQLPDEQGFLPVEAAYLARLKAGDGLWLMGDGRRFYLVDGITDRGVYLSEAEGSFSGGGDANLPAMRTPGALLPADKKPLVVEVEHADVTGPGEMVIELYGKDEGGLFKTAGNEEDAALAESLKGLLRMQIKTMESTAEIGNLWIRRLKEKQRRK